MVSIPPNKWIFLTVIWIVGIVDALRCVLLVMRLIPIFSFYCPLLGLFTQLIIVSRAFCYILLEWVLVRLFLGVPLCVLASSIFRLRIIFFLALLICVAIPQVNGAYGRTNDTEACWIKDGYIAVYGFFLFVPLNLHVIMSLITAIVACCRYPRFKSPSNQQMIEKIILQRIIVFVIVHLILICVPLGHRILSILTVSPQWLVDVHNICISSHGFFTAIVWLWLIRGIKPLNKSLTVLTTPMNSTTGNDIISHLPNLISNRDSWSRSKQ